MALRALNVLLTADSRKFSAGLAQAQRQLAGFRRAVGRGGGFSLGFNVLGASSPVVANLAGQYGRLAGTASRAKAALGSATGAVGLFAGALAAAGAGLVALGAGMVRRALPRIAALGDIAEKLNAPVAEIQALHLAARLSGTSTEALNAGLLKLSKTLGEAAAGAKAPREALARLGLDADKLARKTPTEAFRQIVGGFERIHRTSERAMLATALFGKGGTELLQVLQLGQRGLDEFTEKARRFGHAMDEADAAQVKAVDDALVELSAAWEGLENELTVQLAPALIGAIGALTEFTVRVREVGEEAAKSSIALGGKIGATAGKGALEAWKAAVGGVLAAARGPDAAEQFFAAWERRMQENRAAFEAERKRKADAAKQKKYLEELGDEASGRGPRPLAAALEKGSVGAAKAILDHWRPPGAGDRDKVLEDMRDQGEKQLEFERRQEAVLRRMAADRFVILGN